MDIEDILRKLQAKEITPEDANQELNTISLKVLEQYGDKENTLMELEGNVRNSKIIDSEKTLIDYESDKIRAESLGNPLFQKQYHCKWNYYAGSMYRGIMSEKLVIAMANSGLLSIYGNSGLNIDELELRIKSLQSKLQFDKYYGMCLVSNLNHPEEEMEQVKIFIKYNIPVIEAAAYSGITEALVYCRIKGLHREGNKIVTPRRIIGKCSRLEVAQKFLSPPPKEIVDNLVQLGMINEEEAQLSQCIPMINDLAIEGDSGGHTDQGVSFTLIPPMIALKEKMKNQYNYNEEILVGCGGGIGTPEAVSAAFMLGADFIFTGSINQCTVESGAHDVAKDILNTISIHDTTIVVAGDMFEIGSKMQVVKKNTMFHIRANRLYQLFHQYNSIDEIPEVIRKEIETQYFKKTFVEVWSEICKYKSRKRPEQIIEANENPRYKMSLIIKWYFSHCTRITLKGDLSERDNFSIYSGPALGSFNQWVKGTKYENWRNRHVAKIAELLMINACKCIERKQYVITDNIKQQIKIDLSKSQNSIKSITKKDALDYENDSIAIIGMSGQFPKARNLIEFWENLANGKNCISEIPDTLWSINDYYDEDQRKPGKTYSKWIGALEDRDKFDPLFFNISPAEAELMDPQQRLFLENCWSCIEDSGINPSSLSGSQCGVFVGCSHGDYGDLKGDDRLNSYGLVGENVSILSARISYLLNLKGPCLAIDTACSSSLVAISEACNSLALKTSDLALAGGVCIMNGPSVHIMASKSGMLSKDGRCYSFDDRANGFVPGEGVGVVLLKRLSDAVRDKDQIYGVIRGWGINQDGKTNGITAPSVNSQVLLEKEVYNRFDINPEKISMIETHGTGTKLGDPIEVEALTEAFQSYTDKKNYCVLGAVKSNIGHTLTAAGVAGVIKVLLSLKNNMIPPSINFNTLNKHILLNNSPFYVNTELKPWKSIDGIPRSAGVNSFGFSGTNAHIVIEEYLPKTDNCEKLALIDSNNPILFVLSAKGKEQLKSYVKSMKNFIENHKKLNMSDMAYTLQVGREAMNYRLAIIADSRDTLLRKLTDYINNSLTAGIITSQVTKNKSGIKIFQADEDAKILLSTWIEKNKLDKIAELWVEGLNIEWNNLYKENTLKRISLPTYPFARESYWVSKAQSGFKGRDLIKSTIHPLVHQNTSDLSEQRFSSTFVGDEFFIADYMVNGHKELSRMAYLEMARVAVERAVGNLSDCNIGMCLKNVIWGSPIIIGEQPVQVHISVYPDEKGDISYEIYSDSINNSEVVVHGNGRVDMNSDCEVASWDIQAIQNQCDQSNISPNQLYSILNKKRNGYGDSYQVIEEIFIGKGQALARVKLQSSITDIKDEFVLHPCLMESAMMVAMGLMSDVNEKMEVHTSAIPLTLDSLEVLDNCTDIRWVVLRYYDDNITGNNDPKLDIDFCNKQGNICIRIKGLEIQRNIGKENIAKISSQTSYQGNSLSNNEEDIEIMTFEEGWSEESLSDVLPNEINTIVCFLSNKDYQQVISEEVQQINPQTKVVFISQGSVYQKHSPQEYSISSMDRNTYEKAFQSIQKSYGEIEAMLYFWTLEDSSLIQEYSTIVYILQAMASSQLKVKRLLLAAQFEDKLNDCYLESWIGFERSLELILPNTQVAVIYQDSSQLNQKNVMKNWLNKLWTEIQLPKAQSVLYQGGKRHIYKVRPTKIHSASSKLKTGGTYLITGGCGGLGFLFAEHIAKKYPVHLILVGRSSMNEEIKGKIMVLENLGSQVLYIKADLADEKKMQEGINEARTCFGKIDGVIHAAGVVNNESILEKDMDSFQKTVQPKIQGTIVLDKILDQEVLDFICYFSSSAAILGDFGFCDYAIANRFQMAYANYHNRLESRSKIFVINWPLWRDGGMNSDNEENTEMYLRSSGQQLLEAKEGIMIFEKIIAQDNTQHLILMGRPSRVHQFLGLVQQDESKSITGSFGKGRRLEMTGLSLEQCVEWDLKEHISDLLKVPRDKIDINEILVDLGFDSISMAKFSKILTDYYGVEITPALFFGYSTLDELTQYLLTTHKEVINEFYEEEADIHSISPKEQVTMVFPKEKKVKKSRFVIHSKSESDQDSMLEPIAIIGMSGRFPEAKNIKELWSIINEGRDVVQEIPNDRFLCYKDYSQGMEKSYFKGGWISGVDEFDPLFFEISPREAEFMDPRQRLLLQETWNALEDSGYGLRQINSSKIGMFVGVEPGDYYLLAKDGGSITDNNDAILGSRLAYFLNFSGPVIVTNTACSSGLVTAHQACLSLRNHECDTAIAAGINLFLTPYPFEKLAGAGMLSEDGRCYAFDKSANGMVPGEAVAVVVLKRLSQAQADGDSIYAIIKGSGINYDGKTNGITAPSGIAQTNLIKNVYEQYKVNPEEIEYIVTHGTGTKLGDPVEINALYDAFKDYTKKEGYCALTSTKTNLGHTCAASGLVSLISLVQALRNETIPASLHCTDENNYIKWDNSPFYVNKTKKSWNKKIGKKRIGAVSAFGMSGTNAHMVVESYEVGERNKSIDQPPFYLLAFSAKNQEALHKKIKDMIELFEQDDFQEQILSQISYTLLEGRHHFNHRCAVVIKNSADALHILKKVGSKENVPNIFQGKVQTNFKANKAMYEYAQEMLGKNSLMKMENRDYQEILYLLADLYCQGYDLNWNLMYGNDKPAKISLPSYPFSNERYWIQKNDVNNTNIGKTTPQVGGFIHPLLHRNTSSLSGQRFSSFFTGKENFFSEHRVKGQGVLPGVVYLEMARVAIEQWAGIVNSNKTKIQLKNIIWAKPIVGEKPIDVHIELFLEENEEISYQIYSAGVAEDSEIVLHSQGKAIISEVTNAPALDINEILGECSKGILSKEQCYSTFKALGLDHSFGYQSIEQIYLGDNQALAKISLPSSLDLNRNQFILHPGIMDAALQASIGLKIDGDSGEISNILDRNLVLPFSLGEVEVISACTDNMWALVKYSKSNITRDKVEKFNIDLCDEQGRICVRIKEYSVREVGSKVIVPEISKNEVMLLEPNWMERIVTKENVGINYNEHVVLACELEHSLLEKVESQLNSIRCITLQSKRECIGERFKEYTIEAFEEVQSILKQKPKGSILIQIISSQKGSQQLFAGLAGLLKTAHLENSKIIGQLIEIENGENSQGIITKVRENSLSPNDNWIRYRDGKRYISTCSILQSTQRTLTKAWKKEGVYLITGGTGGLGLIFAKEISEKAKGVKLILTGRSAFTEKVNAKIIELQDLGAEIHYKQVNVVDKNAVIELIKNIKREFGHLNGIFHCAGVVYDNFVINKTKDEVQEVLDPKVNGLVNLDEASKDLDLEIFVLFSSTSGWVGNPGQADYATANAFMDAYARYRNSLVDLKKRQGQTISINWSLWRSGGMHVHAENEKTMQNIGIIPMDTENGIEAFYRILESGHEQVIVLEGEPTRIKEKLDTMSNLSIEKTVKISKEYSSIVSFDSDDLLIKLENALMKTISKLLKVNMKDIDPETELTEYGFDSITFTELTNKINKEYKLELNPTIFFEYTTLQEFSSYILEEYPILIRTKFTAPVEGIANISKTTKISEEPYSIGCVDSDDLLIKLENVLMKTISKLLKVNMKDIDPETELTEYGFDSITFTELTNKINKEFKLELNPTIFFEYTTLQEFSSYILEEYPDLISTKVTAPVEVVANISVPKDIVQEKLNNRRLYSKSEIDSSLLTIEQEKPDDIAIVGISGTFPMAKDLNEFWDNLVEGKDCITEIPKDRWDWSEYYGDPHKEVNKTNIKWGGFVDEIAEFDPLFFGISPKEAELMDPQQRLLMKFTWKVIEDAGYSPRSLSGTRTGIFVGTGDTGYGGLIYRSNPIIEGYTSTGVVPSIGPNRMSYFLDIHGPSEPVETACSSSLVAIHRAVTSMQTGSCDMAIVGGINTLVTPEAYISFNKAGMLCKDGKCKTFSDKANGYVRGEGVGMILLKKLKDAERDGDNIYGLIRGTEENHSGRSNSLTAPNPKAQADVIVSAFRKSDIDPRTVTYIEAHGTGTELGDPIEINGLKTAFKELYKGIDEPLDNNQHCGLGTVKSNIGHLELAAGIAGVIKVLLQMKHKKLVKSLHCDTINPYIQLNDSPFYIVQENNHWESLVDKDGRSIPRRAGISSFGFGGVNAHVVIEEYVPKKKKHMQNALNPNRPYLFILSAKSDEGLRNQAQQLLTAILKQQLSDNDLASMEYTLQVGREVMEERLAVTTGSIKELTEKLKAYMEGHEGIDGLFRGQVKRDKETMELFVEDEDMTKIIETWVSKGKYSKLLDLWVKGMNFDWNSLYGEDKPSRMSLPTYPFAKEYYWFKPNDANRSISNSTILKGLKGEMCLLKKDWEPWESEIKNRDNKSVVIITNNNTKNLAKQLSKHFSNTNILNVSDLKSQINQPLAKCEEYDAMVDLIGCGNDRTDEFMEWIPWLQNLIEIKNDNKMMFLCVTKGLESLENTDINLAGAYRTGLYRMLQSEYGHICSRHMDVEFSMEDKTLIKLIVDELSTNTDEVEVCYRKGQRYRVYLKEIESDIEINKNNEILEFPQNQVLIITGGTRGVGYLCADHFVEKYGVKQLVLTGRERLPSREEWDLISMDDSSVAKKIRDIKYLESKGVQVKVLSLDLTDEVAVKNSLQQIKASLGPIGGIIHCAGLVDKESPAFIRKSSDKINQILSPKVTGLDVLYKYLKNEPLQFFVLFSSVSAIIPKLAIGHSDYAMANAYMDYFAEEKGSRHPIVSIQWPLWKETGMGKFNKSITYKQTGFLSHTDKEGLQLLDYILARNIRSAVLPAVVNRDLWKPYELMRTSAEKAFEMNVNFSEKDKLGVVYEINSLESIVQEWLTSLFSEELKIDRERLSLDTPFQEYGMDSILIAQVIANMDKKLEGVSIEPSALLQFPTLKSLTGYLVKTYPDGFKYLVADKTLKQEAKLEQTYNSDMKILQKKADSIQSVMKEDDGDDENKIAVVGIACHFPGAENIEEYWENLKLAKDCITEVPKNRWDLEKHYDPIGKEGKSIGKWGGFLENIDKFDPQYFKIPEALASNIDPLQRQWLEVSVEALADAGYTKNDLWGKPVGIFAGSRAGTFGNKIGKAQKDSIIGTGQNFIAAHLAHIYNFKGPNMVVDTACSSALTAIHLAVKSIKNKESEVALAGGVDILLDESPFIALSTAKILSPEGRCKAFDSDANGIVLGEGCGVLVLKPYKKAIEENNKIYGIIDGTAINNDGNTMGVTTPNPEVQQELIEAAIKDANINPETITYVETHGTGTLIGDPIELQALTNVINKYTTKKQYCGVGSVKSNMGHLLSASGVASIIKVLLSITQEEIPQTLHCDNPNPRFNFKKSPLYVVQSLTKWKPDNNVLRAGISGFGLGGNNAHIIISNEGVPDSHKASFKPKCQKVIFNRKSYWPENLNDCTEINNNDDGLMEIFNIVEV